MKAFTLNLPNHPNIIINLFLGNIGGGQIQSNIAEVFGHDTEDDPLKAMFDAIESLILAHACAGVNVSSPEYIQGIETAINACENNYYDS